MIKNSAKIQHLYARAGFGIQLRDYDKRGQLSISSLVKRLIQQGKHPNLLDEQDYRINIEELKGMTKKEKVDFRKKMMQETRMMSINWLLDMAKAKEQVLVEKMTLFWHGHFACEIKNPLSTANYLNTIKKHALGNFRDLVLGIARTPAMIRYLNNQQNKKLSPNENFARELMELFTIGRGNYTEQDVKEAARAFTGWSSSLTGDFSFRSKLHDYGRKSFMGRTGDFDGDDIVDILLERKETAQYIVGKIYRYFVNEKGHSARIKALAASFYESNYAIDKLMTTIFESEWFYDEENMGTRIKSPTEYLVSLIKTLGISFDSYRPLMGVQKAMGQLLFKPPNVAGWPGGRSWIDNSTLMLRLNLPMYLANQGEMNFKVKEEFEDLQEGKSLKKLQAKLNTKELEKAFASYEQAELYQQLCDFLLLTKNKPPYSVFQSNFQTISSWNDVSTYALKIMSLPEYQMC